MAKAFKFLRNIVFLFLTFLLLQNHTWASVGSSTGYDARTAGLSNPSAISRPGAFSAFENPATLASLSENSLAPNSRYRFGYGFVWAKAFPKETASIVTESPLVSTRTDDQTGTYVPEAEPVWGQVLGASFVLAPSLWNLTAGLASFAPVEQVTAMDTGETYLPSLSRYQNLGQAPELSIGFGVHPTEKLEAGFGAQLMYRITGKTDAFFASSSTKSSTARLRTKAKPVFVPFFGLLFHPTSNVRVGTTLRLPAKSQATFRVDSRGEVLAGVGSFRYGVDMQSTVVYEPLTWSLGAAWQHSPIAEFLIQAEYQKWKDYEVPAIKIEPTIAEGVSARPSVDPTYPFRNVWILRVAEEVTFEPVTMRAGYTYSPSILEKTPTGAGNLIDPDIHRMTLGAGRYLSAQWHLEAYLIHEFWGDAQVTKTANNETGASGNKIGSPGYTSGGHLWGAGFTLGLDL